jgi:predicted CopG family antitoxin
MKTITISDDIAERLEKIAEREQRPLSALLEDYVTELENQFAKRVVADAAFASMFGMFDDDVTDMSTTVRETLDKHFRDEHGRPD